jgi:iron complex transport system substrate-binding protein
VRPRVVPVITALLLLVGLLAGWGGAPAAGAATTSRLARIGVTAASGRGGGGFPVSVTSADGTVRIPSRPTRILSLSASATQMVYAIGAGPQVVGVDEYSTYPSDAPRTKFTGYETSAEDYLPLRPDLVILAFDESNMVAQLKTLGIPALLLPPANTLAGAYRQIVELGEATGHRAAAARAVATEKADLTRTTATAGNEARGKSYYIELDPTLYSATSNTFIGALFDRLGMHDIADAAGHGSSYPQLSAEYLLKANPDYVFLADTVCCQQTAATFASRPGFSGLRAVRLHHVIPVNDSLASEWGPHSMEGFLQVVARAVGGRGKTG